MKRMFFSYVARGYNGNDEYGNVILDIKEDEISVNENIELIECWIKERKYPEPTHISTITILNWKVL